MIVHTVESYQGDHRWDLMKAGETVESSSDKRVRAWRVL